MESGCKGVAVELGGGEQEGIRKGDSLDGGMATNVQLYLMQIAT